MGLRKIKVSESSIAIVDVKKVLDKYQQRQQFRKLFDVLPLEHILERVMTISYYIDYSEPVMDMLDELEIDLGERGIDMDLFFILLEDILTDIDNVILNTIEVPDEVYYVSVETLKDGSLVLEFMK